MNVFHGRFSLLGQSFFQLVSTPTTCHVSFMRLNEERFVGREKRTNQPHLPNFVHIIADHCSSPFVLFVHVPAFVIHRVYMIFIQVFTPTTCHVSFMRLSEERFVGREKRTNQPPLTKLRARRRRTLFISFTFPKPVPLSNLVTPSLHTSPYAHNPNQKHYHHNILSACTAICRRVYIKRCRTMAASHP